MDKKIINKNKIARVVKECREYAKDTINYDVIGYCNPYTTDDYYSVVLGEHIFNCELGYKEVFRIYANSIETHETIENAIERACMLVAGFN